MKVKDIQKVLKQGLNYFSKYKPSDLIVCETGDEYQKNYWRSHPYLTLNSGNVEKCGIKLSQKSRGDMNKVIIKSEEPEEATNENIVTVEVREVKRLLTEASRELEKFIEEATIQSEYRPIDVTTPFISVYDAETEDFHFVSLNNLSVKDEEVVTVESNDSSLKQFKKLIRESKSPKREIYELAELWIDEKIDADDRDYTFQKVRYYATHGKRGGLDYQSIAIGMLDEYSNIMSPEVNEILEDFTSVQENPVNARIVKDAIDFAVEQLANSLSPYA